jgi:flagellar FliJ protein
MTRTKRIEPVRRLVDDKERELAQGVAQTRERLVAAETKHDELRRYRDDYQSSFQKEAKAGASGLRLRDYRQFLARLDEAVRAQEAAVGRARADVEMHSRQWQESARRARALGVVVDKWRGEELRAAEQQDQRETDERAAGIVARRLQG